ncbi:MAG: BREX system Lon protease-like protein BrxL [Deltaproteobacteria bacterium]|nr:BREX system Lon protease-like protein BrxL [Deltaproteobacteria bacterium]
MDELDTKINTHFEGSVVRKDLVKTVKGNAIVPSYVLEYLLGQYCATSDEPSIKSGIETVKEVLKNHYVHRNEAGLIRSTIKEKGHHKVIDKIRADLNDRTGAYEATFSNLGINKVIVDSDTINKHKKLLVSGIWCIADMEYAYTEDKTASPWILDKLKPIQLSNFDYEKYIETRKQFTTNEWIDLLIQSIGFNPKYFSRRLKLLQLVRLIPFCERNYNLIELGPKGTGKSHIYSEFSPHGMLVSGGEISVPKLFVNNSTGKIGLVGYWDVVALDEFAGKTKRTDKALVDILKNYMANKSFSRGIETQGAEASMVFVGNTQNTVEQMLKHTDLFDELPPKYHDSAFLDRLHFYIPGWEIDILRNEMYSEGYGFVVDYLAEILRSLRNQDYTQQYKDHFILSSDISTRDGDGINKTFSGMMKILFPHGEASKGEIEELLNFSIEGRKRVKDQLMRIDPTYPDVDFSYKRQSGVSVAVKTSEENEFPNYYYQKVGEVIDESGDGNGPVREEKPEDVQIESKEDKDSDQDSNPAEIEIFHKYELLKELPAAGMAEVFKARHTETGHIVFLKRVKTSSCNKDALEREMRIYDKLMRSQNRYFVEILDHVRDDHYIAIISDYVEGGDLENYVKNKNDGQGLSVDEAKRIGLNLAEAVKEIHSDDIIHRDLKPANILYSEDDNVWKLTDFGISKNLSRMMTQKTFQKAGTLGYMAPEQLEGVQAAPSADIYSLGKIFIYLLTGQTDPDHVQFSKWKDLVGRCINLDAARRPNIDEVLGVLREIPS